MRMRDLAYLAARGEINLHLSRHLRKGNLGFEHNNRKSEAKGEVGKQRKASEAKEDQEQIGDPRGREILGDQAVFFAGTSAGGLATKFYVVSSILGLD